jgi:hypothetical protein
MVILFLGQVAVFDVSLDGNIVVGKWHNLMIAQTATGEVLWQKEMNDEIIALRIHGGVIAVVPENCNTVVLDISSGEQIHELPSAGKHVLAICVFDGLAPGLALFFIFSHVDF